MIQPVKFQIQIMFLYRDLCATLIGIIQPVILNFYLEITTNPGEQIQTYMYKLCRELCP